MSDIYFFHLVKGLTLNPIGCKFQANQGVFLRLAHAGIQARKYMSDICDMGNLYVKHTSPDGTPYIWGFRVGICSGQF